MKSRGIHAHAVLARQLRGLSEDAWFAAGGRSLLDSGIVTVEYTRHQQMFSARYVDRGLQFAYNEHREDAQKQEVHATQSRAEHLSTVIQAEEWEDAALCAESSLVLSRSGEREVELLADCVGRDGITWHLDWSCDVGFPPTWRRPALRRGVVDGFCADSVCRDLAGHAIQAMEGVRTIQGQTTVAASDLAHAGEFFGNLVEQMRTLISSTFALGVCLHCSGAVLSRILPTLVEAGEGPYSPHVDRVRVPSDDFAAILYLGAQGKEFDGGGLVFVDQHVDRRVVPLRGRLVAFSTGPENLHRVERVTRGARFALAVWFMLSEPAHWVNVFPSSTGHGATFEPVD